MPQLCSKKEGREEGAALPPLLCISLSSRLPQMPPPPPPPIPSSYVPPLPCTEQLPLSPIPPPFKSPSRLCQGSLLVFLFLPAHLASPFSPPSPQRASLRRAVAAAPRSERGVGGEGRFCWASGKDKSKRRKKAGREAGRTLAAPPSPPPQKKRDERVGGRGGLLLLPCCDLPFPSLHPSLLWWAILAPEMRPTDAGSIVLSFRCRERQL